jgi:hypothetical protein
LLHDVENLLRQRFVGDGPGCLGQICHCENRWSVSLVSELEEFEGG